MVMYYYRGVEVGLFQIQKIFLALGSLENLENSITLMINAVDRGYLCLG